MRVVGVTCVIATFGLASLGAQQSDPAVSVESIRLALQQAHRTFLSLPPVFTSLPGRPTRLGILTFAPPDSNGEIVKLVVPVGDFTTRLARSLSHAQRHRAERKAHDAVQRAVEDFQAQRAVR